ncbi:hypothetical protein DPMN_137894 [Dreissena polymorpha]|uniref:Uncharacterized protein n=1 Tax=Dreissena polymorpha TaxID=45954 RepID=A0A9D4G3B2_DREPO|nr:hypothetical protein DPMN_137894 [Dreissena polymorpha]
MFSIENHRPSRTNDHPNTQDTGPPGRMPARTLRTQALLDERPPEHRGHRPFQKNARPNTEDTGPPGRIPYRTMRAQALPEEYLPDH